MADWRPTPLIQGSYALHGVAVASAIVMPSTWPWVLGAVAVNHALITTACMLPRSKWLGPNITRLPDHIAASRRIALTIDDGPHPENTPRVLDLLDAANAKATFFCIGTEVVRHAALAREIVARGHCIENHSQHHLKRFATLGPRRMRAEVAAAQDSIAATVGRVPRFFRPTAGFRNPFLDPILADLDLRLATWTRRPFDTRCNNADQVVARLTHDLRGGDILLMHDGNSARSADGQPVFASALPRLLERLHTAGLQSITLDQAFESNAS